MVSAATTIQSLSFSRYLRLKRCQLSGARLSMHSDGWDHPPQSRHQVLGKMFHLAMQRTALVVSDWESRGSTLRAVFNEILDEIHSDIRTSPSSRHLGDPRLWPETTGIYRGLAELVALRHKSGRDAEVRIITEQRLYSSDGILVGQPDAYYVRAHGVDLVDFKSGLLLEGDRPKLDYVEQLYFYAYLIRENYGSYPTELSLVGKDGSVIELESEPQRSLDIANAMRATLADYSEAIVQGVSLERLAVPSSETCCFCNRKPICVPFWRALPSLKLPSWNHVALGTQLRPVVRSRLGASSIDLKIEQSSISAQELKVTRVFEERYPDVDLEHHGQKLLITGLRQSGSTTPSVAEATERSVIVATGATK